MKSYESFELDQLKILDGSTINQKEFYQLSLNKNVQYFKYLDENRIYIKLIGYNDHLIVNIKRT